MLNLRGQSFAQEASMRLQKYLASCGVASRRAAEKLMAEGRVTVDGQVISHMGAQVEPGQDVRVDGRPALPEAEKCYIMYHKPAGEVTTVTDPEGRATVLDKFRDFPCGSIPWADWITTARACSCSPTTES